MFKGTRFAMVAAAAAFAAGCDSIGDGASLQSVQIVKVTNAIGSTDDRAFLCFRETLQLLGTFSDGTIGNFTSRAEWTSSRPEVLPVSNGDLPVPEAENLVFAKGTLVPQQATNAPVTIRATFVGLDAEYTVSQVRAVDSFAVTPATPNIAVGTTLPLTATATLDGIPVNVTTLAQWSLDPLTAPEEDVSDFASIGNGLVGGIVVGLDDSPRTITARAEFPSCPEAVAPADLTAALRVAVPTSIELTREFTSQIILGTSEKLRTQAIFATGPQQDVSTQAIYTSSAPERLIGGMGGTASGRNIFFTPSTSTPGNAVITAQLGTAEGSPTDSVTIPVIAASLLNIAISNPEPIKVNPLQFVQVSAQGRFTRDDGPDVFLDITRHVDWTVGDPQLLAISNQPATAGRLFSLKREPGESTVKATNGAASGVDEDTAAVEICSGPLADPCP